MLLNNIGENRNDGFEESVAGLPLHEVPKKLPPCVEERVTFLSPHTVHIPKKHPYGWTAALEGVAEATLTLPAWSVHATPYYWMARVNTEGLIAEERVDAYSDEAEQQAFEKIGFKSPDRMTWVLHGDNQKALIETFFRHVTPKQSLVFFYLRHSPFEDSGRLLVGAALVDDVRLPDRWPTTKPTAFPNHMWETTLRHTLRPDGSGGILLPMQDLARLSAQGVDVSAALAPAPERDREFSYVTEHVSPDSAVAALMSLRAAALAAREFGCEVPSRSLDWLDAQMNAAWHRRGVAPGLPAVLHRLGFEHPAYSARLIVAATPEDEDPWTTLCAGLEGKRLPGEVRKLFTDTRRKIWGKTSQLGRDALRMMARFDLTHEQVDAVLDRQTSVILEPDELLENPYYLVTCSLDDDDPVDFDTVDRGCFGSPELLSRHPLPITDELDDPVDVRRVEALLASELAAAASEGDTVVSLPDMLGRVERRALVRPLPLTRQILEGLDLEPEYFDDDPNESWPVIAGTRLADGSAAYKLRTLLLVRETIREMSQMLQGQPRHAVPNDLESALDTMLGPLEKHDPNDIELERRARREKTAALRELYAGRFTVLNGPAGTGKTTLIKALIHHPTVANRGVLLVAPTGKARVQLAKKADHDAVTVAQFLARTDRYDGNTGRYRVTGDPGDRAKYGTVVVDEASMLTETMLAALMDALVPPGRLILVGDPRQLPPIGEGRPFVDLERAARARHDGRWPAVAPGWAELTVLRRQQGHIRDDLMLAKWFAGDEIPEGFDDVWERIRRGDEMPSLRAVSWEGRSPEQVIDDVLTEELGVRTDDDGRSFAASYGATVEPHVNYFDAAAHIEKWQILSPFRNYTYGTVRLNRHLKETHRGFELRKAQTWGKSRSVPEPLGPERIVLGDKVVNTRNRSRAWFWSKAEGESKGYLANGEIGVVIGQIKTKAMKKPPWKTQVEYSSQLGRRFTTSMGSSETDAPVELAWALTVHKAQGSEFGLVVVMLPAGARRVSRELLYTALTRQTDRVVLCHEGPIDELLELTRASGSDTGRRMTDLTLPPAPVAVRTSAGPDMSRLDAGLVHVSKTGVLVRSKNELIIAGILEELAPGSWVYEQPLVGGDGRTRVPDFTITTADGRTVYWEHLGMLDNPAYAAAWEKKRAWYAEQGVTEAGGPLGVLFTTDDREGVDEPRWREQAREIIGKARVSSPRAVKRVAAKKKR
ncbi:AAA family ATPase [Rhodococcus sp. SJ]